MRRGFRLLQCVGTFRFRGSVLCVMLPLLGLHVSRSACCVDADVRQCPFSSTCRRRRRRRHVVVIVCVCYHSVRPVMWRRARGNLCGKHAVPYACRLRKFRTGREPPKTRSAAAEHLPESIVLQSTDLYTTTPMTTPRAAPRMCFENVRVLRGSSDWCGYGGELEWLHGHGARRCRVEPECQRSAV